MLGVAELEPEPELKVGFVELDVMVTVIGLKGCTSPVNASALILLGHSKLSWPVTWGMNSPVTSMKLRTSCEALVHVFTMQEDSKDTACPSFW